MYGICTAAGLRRPTPFARDLVQPPSGPLAALNEDLRYPPDPPTAGEIIPVMLAAGDAPEGVRLRAMIVVLWHAGLRISEALALAESDLDRDLGAVVARQGKAASDARSEWTVGDGTMSIPGSSFRPSSQSDHCSACSAVRLAAGHARQRGSAASCVPPPKQPGCAVASPRASYGTRMR